MKLAVSFMPETGFESVEPGETAESASVALILDRTSEDGTVWTGSLGVEKVLKVEGGGSEAAAFQVGLNRATNGWTLGGAVALTDNGDGTRDRGVSLGVIRDVSDKLAVSIGVNRSVSHTFGADLTETSVTLIWMVPLVTDKVFADAGLWRIRSVDAGASNDRAIVGLGLSLYF